MCPLDFISLEPSPAPITMDPKPRLTYTRLQTFVSFPRVLIPWRVILFHVCWPPDASWRYSFPCKPCLFGYHTYVLLWFMMYLCLNSLFLGWHPKGASDVPQLYGDYSFHATMIPFVVDLATILTTTGIPFINYSYDPGATFPCYTVSSHHWNLDLASQYGPTMQWLSVTQYLLYSVLCIDFHFQLTLQPRSLIT